MNLNLSEASFAVILAWASLPSFRRSVGLVGILGYLTGEQKLSMQEHLTRQELLEELRELAGHLAGVGWSGLGSHHQGLTTLIPK